MYYHTSRSMIFGWGILIFMIAAMAWSVMFQPSGDEEQALEATTDTTVVLINAATTEAATEVEEEKKKDDPSVYSIQHNSNMYFILKDDETGCQYIQATGQEMVPRLGRDGKPLCGKVEPLEQGSY